MTEKASRNTKKLVKHVDKKYKCPYCGKQTNGHSAHNGCNMVIDKRGGWRQLGVYDG
jgi:transcription elongation factor Elf1